MFAFYLSNFFGSKLSIPSLEEIIGFVTEVILYMQE